MEPIPDPGGLSLRKTSPPSSAVTRLVSVAPGKGGPGATNPKILCFFAKDFCAFSWERTHPACRELETPSTLEACAPRQDLSVLRVFAVRFLVAALLIHVNPSGTFFYRAESWTTAAVEFTARAVAVR